MNYYPNYTGQYYMPQQNRYPQPLPIENYNQFMQSNQPRGLQGKSVDNIDVVKAMDINLDGTISYFPLTDGSAIVTKQITQDGTSKTIIYKRVDDSDSIEQKEYLTKKDLEEDFNKLSNNNNNLREEIKNIKKQIKEIALDLDEIKERKD